MPSQQRKQHWPIAWLISLMGCLLVYQSPLAADAERSIVVTYVSTRLVNEVYELDARIHYGFTPAVLEALESGVPITLEMEIEVLQPRRWIWSDSVARLSQRYRIQYHALTRQYVVTNLNSDVQSSYPSLRAAVNALGTVRDLPILDRRLLKVGGEYVARLRAILVLSALPAPLRLWAYLTPEWWQQSEWYTWRLQ
jgi:hypothetical protein